MSRPFKHPKTGVYYYRKRVPDQLRSLLGKREEKVTLGTRDPVEAKVLHAQVGAQVEERWRLLTAGVLSLTEKQATAVAGEIYKGLVTQHENNPSRLSFTELLYDKARFQPKKVKVMTAGNNAELARQMLEKMLDKRERRMRAFAEGFLMSKGLRLDEHSMKMVLDRVSSAVIQAEAHIVKMAGGDYSPDPAASRFPAFEMPQPAQPNRKGRTTPKGDDSKYGVVQTFKDYANEKAISNATYIKWQPIIEGVAVEVPDIRELTKSWVVGWKDKLIKSGLSQRHVRDSHLAALKAVCTWGVSNDRLDSNPVSAVTVSVPRKVVTRGNGFTPTEAAKILSATLRPIPTSSKMTPRMRAARRWVPWLCAYTGSRVGEISQLRKQDIQLHEGHWLVWITPEAGSTKNHNPRFVAMHSHLIEQGFLDFVQSAQTGPLFYDKAAARKEEAKHPQHKKVGEKICKWVRQEVGITDERVKPNHAWRHGFKTRARSARMDVGTRDYMQGHVPATEGEGYGEFPPAVLSHEIEKLPRFTLEV